MVIKCKFYINGRNPPKEEPLHSDVLSSGSGGFLYIGLTNLKDKKYYIKLLDKCSPITKLNIKMSHLESLKIIHWSHILFLFLERLVIITV